MHVLIISVGPVQEFIASARKCRDLWFGSWLLSELSRATAQGVLGAAAGAEADVLVFPGASLQDSTSVANKVVARVESDPHAVAAGAESSMRARLAEIRDAAFRLVGRGDPRRSERFLEDTARAQVDAIIEFVWASVEEGEGGYLAAREEAERVLAGAKATKRWEQPAWAEDGVVKSSLDGVRESALDELLFENPRSPGGRGAASEGAPGKVRSRYGVHGAERLCGVGLLKRFGNCSSDKRNGSRESGSDDRPDRIFSTSHLASGPFRKGLEALPEGAAAFNRYAEALEGLEPELEGDVLWNLDVVPVPDPITRSLDGSVFYEGRLVEEIEEMAADKQTARRVASKASGHLRKFLREVRALGEPIPYYGILLADGDHMGAVIDACANFGEHRALSEALEGFATAARETVGKHEGRLVYSGGDDVLALLPLHRMLECARRLEADFRATMAKWKAEIGGEERSATLSVGLVVAHALDPLGGALELARAAEAAAKRVEGKNGLAILVQPRSGALVEVSGAFPTWSPRIDALVGLHRTGAISARTQHELMELAERTAIDESQPGDQALAERLQLVVRAEAQRILARKRTVQGEGLTGPTRETLDAGAYDDPSRLGRELYVAGHFARAMRQAEPITQKPEAAA